MRSRRTPRCAACEKRISEHEPCCVLRHIEGDVCGYYHARCQGAALKLFEEAPEAWIMGLRFVKAEANDGLTTEGWSPA